MALDACTEVHPTFIVVGFWNFNGFWRVAFVLLLVLLEFVIKKAPALFLPGLFII